METIGFIGIGPLCATLARFSVKVGMSVIVSGINKSDDASSLAASLGCGARAMSAADCAKESEIVVATIPLSQHKKLPAKALDGKIVVDTCNYFPEIDGNIAELDDKSMTSSELVQKHLPGAKVVKAFYNLDRWHLENGARPFGAPDRWALPIAGDDDAAAAVVARWMGMVGFDPVFCGTLADSWRIQAGSPIFMLPYVGYPPLGMTDDEIRIWYRWDRSRSVRDDDVTKYADMAKREMPPHGKISDLPAGLIDG